MTTATGRLEPSLVGLAQLAAGARRARRCCRASRRQLKARLQYRRGPSIWQPYRDLAKWWGKAPVESDTASAAHRGTPR